jgi:hypothetical protein
MLSLITRYHVYRLLKKVEVEVLITRRRREVEIAVDKCLATGIE